EGRGAAPVGRARSGASAEPEGRRPATGPAGPAGRHRADAARYSHSMVPGGFDVMSYATRFTPGTSLMIRVDNRSNRSYGNRAQSAVIASSLVTARTMMG